MDVVLVEGTSDRVALETLARRRGRDLRAEGISIVAMGGSKAISVHLQRLRAAGAGGKVAGLCDAAEERDFRRGLERAGLGAELSRVEMEAIGFFVCIEDLEDELIRSLGTSAVEEIVDVHGDLPSLRTFQKQPAQQGRSPEAQLRRFMGTKSGRKIEYARLLVEALDLARVPRPLDGVLDHV